MKRTFFCSKSTSCKRAGSSHACCIEITTEDYHVETPTCITGVYDCFFNEIYSESEVTTSVESGKDTDVPPQLPDWCKVGEWVFDENSTRYYKIEKVNGNNLFCNGFHTNTMEGIMQARVRPWTFEEAPLVLKARRIINDKSYIDILHLKVYVAENPIYTYWSDAMNNPVNFKRIADRMEQLDGSPCGVLEHLNDNGEWVE